MTSVDDISVPKLCFDGAALEYVPVTVVTAYYPMLSKASHETYMAWASNFLRNVGCHLRLYTCAALVPAFADMRFAFYDRTEIVVREFDTLEMATPEWMDVWAKQAELDTERNHSPELYAIWAQKSAFVADAIEHNIWKSNYFVWCDIGCFRSEERAKTYCTFPAARTTSCLLASKVHFLLLQDYKPSERVCGSDGFPALQTHHIGGGIFICHKHGFAAWHAAYIHLLHEGIQRQKFIGKDQPIYDTLYLRHPELVHVFNAKADQGDPWFYMQYIFK